MFSSGVDRLEATVDTESNDENIFLREKREIFSWEQTLSMLSSLQNIFNNQAVLNDR